MKIVLLEFIHEFEMFQKFVLARGLNIDDFHIIVLEPKLGAYFNKRNIPYQNTLYYFDNDSHKKILLETEKAMKYIRGNFTFNDSNGLRGCIKENMRIISGLL